MFNKKYSVDPIGAMCRLIMLNFRPVNTKIAIHNHCLIIQPPSGIQWASRYIKGDDRDGVSELFPVIIRVTEWFIHPLYQAKFNKIKNPKIINNIFFDLINKQENILEELEIPIEKEEIFKLEDKEVESYWGCVSKLATYMCYGMEKLQETYNTGNVIFSIQCFINIINDALHGNHNKNKIPKCLINNREKEDTKELITFNKIRELWDYKKLNEICELYDKCFNVQDDNTISYHHKLEAIEGYLKAIENLLNISDENFIKLIFEDKNL
jgi:hypothetical protein